MNYYDFLKNNLESLEGRKNERCLFSELKEKKNTFLYSGIYVLVDQNDEVIYIGSSYVRNLRSRLLQYQQTYNTGNKTLINDLVEANKTTESDANEYIKSLTIYAFEDKSLEYELINMTEGVVNFIGKNKK